jgi:hypothetical protein
MVGGSTVVMGTGIVSLDLASAGWSAGSDVLGALAAAVWLALAATGELWSELAGVSATAVLGTRLLGFGWTGAAWPLLALAGGLCAVRLPRVRLGRRTTGADLLAVVVVQSLAVLAGRLGGDWLRVAAHGLLAVGLVLYVAIVSRLDARELRRGAGDQWIAGGALAISALAAADIGLRPLDHLLAAAALAWLPVLIAGELAAPRAGDPGTRWSTVFPVGMYAAMAFAVGLTGFAHVWAWVALAVWALAAVYTATRPARRSRARS